MADEKPNGTVPPRLPENLGKLILDPFQHCLAAYERQALAIGVPAHDMVELLLNHLASVVSLIEPPGARAATVEGLVAAFSKMVQTHLDARKLTPGGVYVP